MAFCYRGIVSKNQGAALTIYSSSRVDFGSGKPVNGMRITLAPDGPLSNRTDLIRTIFTNGEFKLTDLAPGSYRIFAWEKFEFELAQSPEFLSLFSASSVRVAEGNQTMSK
jgi:hypothetical protein